MLPSLTECQEEQRCSWDRGVCKEGKPHFDAAVLLLGGSSRPDALGWGDRRHPGREDGGEGHAVPWEVNGHLHGLGDQGKLLVSMALFMYSNGRMTQREIFFFFICWLTPQMPTTDRSQEPGAPSRCSTWVARSQVLGSSSAASPGGAAGSWIESGGGTP